MADRGARGATPADGGARPKPSFWQGLGFQVAVGMALGVVVGLVWPEFGASLKILGDLFIRLIRTAVAPLVFLTVISGILAAGDVKQVGKVGLIAVVYFEVVSFVSLILGMVAANLFGVGKDLGRLAVNAGAAKGVADATKQAAESHGGLLQFVTNIIPDNFVGAFVRGDLLQILLLAVLFGFALLRLKQDKRAPIERVLKTASAAFFEFIHIILRAAPVGAFGAMAYAVGANGAGVVASLAYLVLTYYLTIFVFLVVVVGGICLVFRINLIDLLLFIKDELVIVLGTASSEPVLPRLLEKLPLYGASKQTVGLVLPTGFAFNLDGGAVFLAFSVIFIANAYHVPLSLQQQFGLLMLMAVTSKGTAGVTGGVFVVLAATVPATGFLPIEGLALIFGVYRFMSMIAAFCNVIGNVVATMVVAKICGEFDPARRDDAAAAAI